MADDDLTAGFGEAFDLAKEQLQATQGHNTNPQDFAEASVARRFAAAMAGELLYDHSDKSWSYWDGSVWRRDETGSAMEAIKHFVERERAGALLPEDAKSLGKVRFVMAIELLARSDPKLAVHGSVWNRDPWLLGTPGGVVNLRTGATRPGSPGDYISKMTSVVPAERGTPTPLWDKFLDDATRGQEDTQAFLQRWAGYCLTGDVSEEVLCFLYGPGGNGKGVFTRVVAAILGSYSISMPIEAFTAGGRTNQEYYRAQMAGARLVTASETEGGKQWAEAQIKELTGNEAEVSARQPYGRPYNYWPQAKLQFVGNHAPSLKGDSPAMRRRLRIIPFEHKPKNPDHGLKDRMVAEYPAILRWIIEGCLNWQSARLGTAPAIEEASSRYFEAQDVFGKWLGECCLMNPSGQVAPGKLQSKYRDWCKANGETPLTPSEFREAIDRRPGLGRKTVNGDRLVTGISFKVTAQQAEQEGRRYGD